MDATRDSLQPRSWTPAALARPARSLLAILSLALVLLTQASSALAQDQPPDEPPTEPPTPDAPVSDPMTDPELTDESVESVRESLRERGASRILYPSERADVDPALPPGSIDALLAAGLPALEPGGPRPPLLAEGSFLVRRRGVLLMTDWGAHIFAFAPDETGERMRPMVVLPCDTLTRMESAAHSTRDPGSAPTGRVMVIGHFLVTGQVTTYRARNCLSPTAFVLADETGAPPAQPPVPAPRSPTRSPEDDPEIDSLITDLEALRTTPRPSATPQDRISTSGDESLIPEGTAIARRKGRLVRSGRGEVAVAFDTGPDGREDPPMTLLPCAATEGLERAVVRYGDNTPFEFSGRVFTYKSRNYLLPLMYVAESSRNLKTLR